MKKMTVRRPHLPGFRPRSPRLRVVLLAAALVVTGGCGAIEDSLGGSGTPAEAAPLAAPADTDVPFNSEFSRDGTFQSHIPIDEVDFVFTIWSAKTTPRMQEWYPQGDKFFSFTFTGYDTRRRLRDKFATKRRIYLDDVAITSVTTSASGTTESPYNLREKARDVTFDPEAVQSRRYGMLITSPKGAFELRNQRIGTMAADTEGVTLTFTATVHIETGARTGRFETQQVVQTVPISIFKSEVATRPQPVPYNAT
ncbi:hypothetical protein BJ980_002700 [Nocardioides daedukensis]|uniref:Uncharacterized protein n=1 Tax=Nocardioides daedukensis TaxID=634462 RepID=A0A7Y9S3B2_9ACTN|nr:hypothetical protein [Nocardioides daedukensis]NYG59777.1 hypothetical protein [Nocardioides daedukensis]